LNAHLVFLDESGFLMMPHVAKTWGRRGCTPLLYHRARHRQRISAIAALSLSPAHRNVGLFLQTTRQRGIDQQRILGFLRPLLRHLRGSVVLIWDNINTHRSAAVRKWIEKHPRLHVEFFPTYAPELNPVEWYWNDGKCHTLANHGLDQIEDLERRVVLHARRTARNQSKLRSLITSGQLPLRL
jgi:putative transposase